jgi:hypothetical protein
MKIRRSTLVIFLGPILKTVRRYVVYLFSPGRYVLYLRPDFLIIMYEILSIMGSLCDSKLHPF